MVKLILIKTFLVIILAVLPCFSAADDFKYLSISLFGKQIGFIKVREVLNIDSKVIHVNGKISSSPFRIFNGKFEYKTVITEIDSEASKIHYESNVDATLKERKISYWVRNDRLIAVDVFPKNKKTKFTNPKKIDFEFIDPAYAITKLLSAPCKNSFKIYDGRRVVDVTSIKPTSKSDCRYVYKIQKGPGHLSPLNFKTFEISTFLDQNGNSAVRSMIIKTGPFELILNETH